METALQPEARNNRVMELEGTLMEHDLKLPSKPHTQIGGKGCQAGSVGE